MERTPPAEAPPRHYWRYTLLIQLTVLLLLVVPFVSGTFRDNDQATILDGSWLLAHGRAPFFHALFYNFDKQWGVFLALDWLFRALPGVDPVLSANVLLTVLASLAWISLGFRAGRTRQMPLPLLLPIVLSPVLVLYIPYLGTGWFSLAFLLLSYFFLGNRKSKSSQAFGIFLLGAAAACRGDVALAVPALLLSQISRRSLFKLLRTPLAWLLGAAAVLPVIAGKLMAGASIPDVNPFSLDLRAFVGYLVFGLTLAVGVLLVGSVVFYTRVGIKKKRFRLFYLLMAVAPLIPLVFYSPQLYTLRYFFLTIASVLFVTGSRRSVWCYRTTLQRRQRWLPQTLVALTVAPWFIGVSVPVLSHPGLTLTAPTRFPTGDGRFPMGAYLGFSWQVLAKDHRAIDHNENMWIAARSVHYSACPGGSVPFLVTPMSNYLQFAIRLQGEKPLPIDYMAESPCGRAYVDARSILRGYRPDVRDGDFFGYHITFASSAENGQLIANVSLHGARTDEARTLEQLRDVLGRREIDIFSNRHRWYITTQEGLRYAVFGSGPCQVQGVNANPSALIQAVWIGPAQKRRVAVECNGNFAGWAHTTLPPYLGL
ncbi:MAG TPA: hypothetical protein VHZ55_06150 [Bryobacteraceae bacterium]|nr:hypothetical protein [Bryobacteraceae bacterium]